MNLITNRIVKGDAIKELQKLQDNSIDLIVTDPPYRVISGGKNGFSKSWGVLKQNNGKIFEHNDIDIKDYIDELYRILKEGTHCYIMVNNKNLTHFLNESQRAGFSLHQVLIWEKGNITANRWYMKAFEYILFLRKGPAKAIHNKGDSNILRHQNIIGNKSHLTEKPVSLFKQMILNSSNEGDIVLDPFMGTGAAGVACKETNRAFIGFELDKKYFDIAENRILNS